MTNKINLWCGPLFILMAVIAGLIGDRDGTHFCLIIAFVCIAEERIVARIDMIQTRIVIQTMSAVTAEMQKCGMTEDSDAPP